MSIIGDWIAQAWRSMTTFRGSTTYEGREVDVFVHDLQPSGRNAIANMTPEQLWASQPHLRTVIDFRARNISQVKLHLYRRDGEGNAKRVYDHPIAQLIRKPNPFQTGVELIYDLIASRDLYAAAYWFVYQGKSGVEIMPFPKPWVSVSSDLTGPKKYTIRMPGASEKITLDETQVVAFTDYSPSGIGSTPTSKVDTLKEILAAQAYSWRHRINLWLKGTQTGGWVHRPATAPTWDDTSRRRFIRMLEAFSGPDSKGSKAGGVPILEDGMELRSTAFKSADEQWAESVKLSLQTVAQVYQTNPTSVGLLDNANYSNVVAFNRQLYTNDLGSDIVAMEERLNHFLLPILFQLYPGKDNDGLYLKANVEAKMRGSFEEQTGVISAAVGGPWMTRNEARRLQEMPPVDGGDALILPLNLGKPETESKDQALELVLSMVASTPSLAQSPGIPALLADVRAALNGTPTLPPSASPEEEA